MAFTAASGVLMDSTGTQIVCDVTNVRMTDGLGRSPGACVFQPTVDFAMGDRHGFEGYVLIAAGRTLRIQLQEWGMAGVVPYAQAIVVG